GWTVHARKTPDISAYSPWVGPRWPWSSRLLLASLSGLDDPETRGAATRMPRSTSRLSAPPTILSSCSHQLADEPAVVDDGDRPAFGSQELLLRVQAEQVAQRGGQVFGSVGVARRPFGAGVGPADHQPALDAAAAHRHRERRPPVVAAG